MQWQMNYNFRDILWAPAKGFSAKKILVMSVWLLAALVIYDLFTYIALIIAGEKIGSVFSVYGFFPFYSYSFDSISAQILMVLGIALATVAIMLGFAGVAKIEYEAIRGDRFYSPLAALRFSISRLKQIFMAELGIVSFLLFVILLFFLFGLISRIPYVGNWLYAILFLIPNFIIAIFTVFIFFVLIVSIILLPTAAVADNKAQAFQAIVDTFSTIIRRPINWVLYTLYGLSVSKIFSFIYAYFAYRAVQFTVTAGGLGGGDKIHALTKQAVSHLPYKSDVVNFFITMFPGIDFGFSLTRYFVRSSGDPASYILSIMLFLIFVSVIGYFLSAVATSQLRAFLVIRYLKDGVVVEKIDNQSK